MRRTLPSLPLVLFLFLAVLAPVLMASAQAQAQAQASGTPAVPPGEAARLLGVLRDDARRAELLRTLEALSAAEAARSPATPAATPATVPAAAPATTPATTAGTPPAAEGATAPAPAATPAVLVPNTLFSQLLSTASERLGTLSEQVVGGVRAITDLPNVVAWASGVARDPVTRTRILDAAWKLMLVFGLGILCEYLTHRLILPWRNRLDAMAPAPGVPWGLFRRVPILMLRVLTDLLPVAAFALVSYGLIGAVNPLPTTQLVLLTANNAYIAARAVMVAFRMLFSPASPHLRLVPVLDETAAYITVWMRRLVVLLITGWALAEASLLFGVPWSVYDAILRLTMLVGTLFLVIVVLQNRAAVAAALRAPPLRDGEEARGGRRFFRGLRDRLAEIWHIVAILWLVAAWGVWALEVRDGFERLLRSSGVTLLILGAAKLVDVTLRRMLTRGFQVGHEMAGRFPGLEERANRYVPALKAAVTAMVTVVAGLSVLEAWGVGAFEWFTRGRLGSQLVSSLISIGLTLLVALAVWEASNAAIARALAKQARETAAARGARMRTLLPLLRTGLTIVITVFVVLNILSVIGVNIAPLIAGAGVIGVAIGLGAQRLVTDVITGVILLVEDTMAVGDTVTLGTPPMTGVVERLTIRSIRLRAVDGTVHSIPFSAVNAVSNMTRDFAFAMFEMSLSYNQDTDVAADVMRGIVKEMRAEPRWGALIRDDLDVMGVEKLAETGVVLRARLKTEPTGRWPVTREVNKRVRAAFDARGIIIPSPWRVEPEAEAQEAAA